MRIIKLSGFVLVLVLCLSCCTPKEKNVTAHGVPAELSDKISREEIHVFLVYKEGDLIWSQYKDGWKPEDLHIIHSCTKSILSLLIGTLFDQGILESVDTPVYTLFSDIPQSDISEENKKITLKHFLTMSTGLRSRDSYLYDWEGINNLWNKGDWVKEILSFKSEVPGGERFDYSNLASFLLGEIVREKTGMDLSEYADKTLFNPLGVEKFEWNQNPNGESLGWGGLHIRPSDLAKIGQLILNDGVWNNEQLVSSQWIRESTSPKMNPKTLSDYYGYQWWIDDDDLVMALGYEGQYLIIDRELNLVTVFACKLQGHKFSKPYNLYRKYVAPQF